MNLPKYHLQPFDVLIENTAGQYKYKYEYSNVYKRLVVDRFLTGTDAHFVNYGFIVHSYRGSDSHLDAVVVNTPPLYHMRVNTIVQCRAMGILEMRDEEGDDPKVLCVPTIDEKAAGWTNYTDIPSWILEGIKHYFSTYKMGSNQESSVVVGDYLSSADAYHLIEKHWISDPNL